MTVLLSVDLAAKLSAAILRGAGGEILTQFDSRNKDPLAFCREVAGYSVEADIIVVEDVPYGVSSQAMVKPVLRLQGALIAYFMAKRSQDRVVFLSPSVWMKDYPGTQHAPKGLNKAAADKYRIDQAAWHAKEAGYTPPDLVAEYVASIPPGKRVLKKDTNVLEKSMTDYVSAFLMSEFAKKYTYDGLVAMNGVSAASL